MWEKAEIVLVIDDTAVRGALKFVLEVEGLTAPLPTGGETARFALPVV